MPKPVAVLLLLVLAATGVTAGELEKSEERFVKDLVDALSDDSTDVRLAAEEALVLMGEKTALWLVPNARKVKSDAADAAVRILVRIGLPAVKEIQALEHLPSGRAGEILERVLSTFKGEGGVGGFGEADPAVDAQVKQIMKELPTGSFSSTDPAVEKLVALGRKAIPSLLRYLSPSQGHQFGFTDEAAKYALGDLCEPRDTPRLSRLLDEGWTKIAGVMAELGDPGCVPALIRALRDGRGDHDIGDAIERLRDPRTRTPVVRFLEEYGDAYPDGTMSLLDVLVEFRAKEAIPVIKRMAKSSAGESHNRNAKIVNCCRALIRLGDTAGFPPLIGTLSLTGTDEWLVNWAGRTLNEVTGQNIWTRGMEGVEARRRYQEWYDSVKGKLVWNESGRVYTVSD